MDRESEAGCPGSLTMLALASFIRPRSLSEKKAWLAPPGGRLRKRPRDKARESVRQSIFQRKALDRRSPTKDRMDKTGKCLQKSIKLACNGLIMIR